MGVNDTGFSDTELSDTNLNQTVLFRGASLPASNFPVGALFLVTSTGSIYENTGTYATPIWTKRLEGSSLITIDGMTDTLENFLGYP